VVTADRGTATSTDRGVVRTCIGCRTKRRSTDLVRCTLRHGVVAVDGPSDGRGAWLCRATLRACARRAIDSGAFRRAWRTDLDGAVVAEIERRIARTAGDAVDGDEARGPR